MNWIRRILGWTIILVLASAWEAEGLTADEMKRITFEQHIGQPISSQLTFQDSAGKTTSLGSLSNTKPTLLVLGYFRCPMLCTLINDGLIESLQELRLNIGQDFNVIDVSIDPKEKPAAAAAKKAEYLKRYGRPGAAEGWHFLTGDEASIAELANEAGFRYRYDPESHEYAHPSGFLVLTPSGRVSRYFFGVNFDPGELRSALTAASEERHGSVIQQLVLLCSHFNPVTGKYGQLVLTVLRFAGVGTVLFLGWWIFFMVRRGGSQDASTEAS